MEIRSWANSKIEEMDWMDIALVKLSSVAFGILLASLVPELTRLDPLWMIVIIAILAIRPFYRVYIK